MEIIWRQVALAGIEQARRYVAEHNPAAAERIFEAILLAARRLAVMPSLGRPGRVPGTRELIVIGTPYIVAYAVLGNQVNILAVQHGAREWPEAF
jgi:toxin ParE1/3/4